jgi:hypothetical protein
MVEAAGVEPSRRYFSNRLMAHDFHDSRLNALSRFTHSESTPVDSYPLVSTPVRER